MTERAVHAEQMADLTHALQRYVRGEVRFDQTSRILYATDASIYQIMPHGVVIPRDADDIAATIAVAREYGVPVLPRGAGTSLGGQAVGAAVVVDTSKYMHALLEVDAEARTCRVQPGMVIAHLNRALEPYGLMFGPDPASLDRATVGGVIGNNSTGAHSILYGMTADNIVAARALLADGTEAAFAPLSLDEAQVLAAQETPEGRLYRAMLALAREYGEDIERDFPRHWRRSSGYNLDRLWRGVQKGRLNLAEVLVGSEGTLAFVTEATLKLVPRPKQRALAVLPFDDFIHSLEAVVPLLETAPSAIELIDQYVVRLTRKQTGYSRALDWVQGDPESVLLVEFFGETEAELQSKLDQMEARMRAWGYRAPILKLLDPAAQARVWYVRKVGLGLLMGIKGDHKPIPFVEDVSVPPEHLAAFIGRFRQIVRDNGTDAAFYAHASAGCLHCRPLINLKSAEGVRMMRRIAEQVVDLALEFGGAMSGEHGDGLARSEFNPRVFGPRLYQAMRELKAAWDPDRLFNPGKVVDAPPMDQNLRYGPEYRAQVPPTMLSFDEFLGFDRAIEQCNGMGVCRNLHGGVMCPSYRATRDEKETTRARANMLRAAISGRLPGGLANPDVFDVLDLCLECKACKSECPSSVDMAKLKYEFLHHYYQQHRRPVRDYLFGYIRTLYEMGAPLAPLVNAVMRSPLARWGQGLLGIDPQRRLPPLHRRTFREWFANHTPPAAAGEQGEVVLYVDTFTNFNYPQQGIAAVKVLEAAGWRVHLAPNVCCGRPLMSKGFLPAAKARAVALLDAFEPLLAREMPVVGLEPSCSLTLRSEVRDFCPDDERAQRLFEKARLFEEFLHDTDLLSILRKRLRPFPKRIVLHVHCHQKAESDARLALSALQKIPEADVQLADVTCCGLAGSFGFEAEHADISRRIAQMGVAQAVRAADVVAVTGVSCRQQIAEISGMQPMHVAEVLAAALM
nr:FAD-binding and (Fe-S)-binding domain-containing protein [Ardenticatena sp.]